MRSPAVLGVLSGCGGAGASVLAAVLAGCAAQRFGHAFLLDCDPLGGGIDVLLGREHEPGPRWAQVRLGGGEFAPDALRGALPSWEGVSFLAADSAAVPEAALVTAVIDAAVAASPVVLDLSRWPSPGRDAALSRCTRTILVTPAEVRGVTASALIARSLDPECASVVVRGSSASLPSRQIADVLGLPLLGELPYDPASLRANGLELSAIRRGTRRLARAVLDELLPEPVAA